MTGHASSKSAAEHVCKHVRWHDGREWADCSCGWQSPHTDAIPNSAAEERHPIMADKPHICGVVLRQKVCVLPTGHAGPHGGDEADATRNRAADLEAIDAIALRFRAHKLTALEAMDQIWEVLNA